MPWLFAVPQAQKTASTPQFPVLGGVTASTGSMQARDVVRTCAHILRHYFDMDVRNEVSLALPCLAFPFLSFHFSSSRLHSPSCIQHHSLQAQYVRPILVVTRRARTVRSSCFLLHQVTFTSPLSA